MEKYRNVSSKDVAREAGVSQATVSYVLNNVPGIKIKPETRQAVLEAAKKLNYLPNLNARSMRLKKSMSIAVVSKKNVSSYGFIKILEGIKDAMIPRDYSITFCFSKLQDNETAQHVQYFLSNRIDGIIFVMTNPPRKHCQYLAEKHIPFVVISHQFQEDDFHRIKNDMESAVREALTDLRSKGHETIGFFGNGIGNFEDRRYATFHKMMEEMQFKLDPSLMIKMPDSDEAESAIAHFFNTRSSLPDAIICEAPGIGFRLLRYLAKTGIRVPETLSITAFGTSKFSPLTYPALSAIESPLYEMGYSAAEMLFNIMSGQPTDNLVVLKWQYVKRESS
ncbi:MAG TPA: LacI family DNA-binding transcriptional regulator [Bacillota bacterium]|nr:LacI family DNA-binding transcriptional regulator [Bacillota bacterium]HPT87721.1 LacI family DNA-binding transcriptional regulator [Bacillota bacterium]